MKSLLSAAIVFGTMSFALSTSATETAPRPTKWKVSKGLNRSFELSPFTESRNQDHPDAPATFLRNARARVLVTKRSFVQVGGNYEERRETACTRDGVVPVYSTSSGNVISGDVVVATCTSQTSHGLQNLIIGGVVILGNFEIPEISFHSDIKALVSILQVGTSLPQQPGLQPSVVSTFATTDTQLHSMIGILQPNNVVSCTVDNSGAKSCSSTYPEIFEANVVVED